MSKLLEIAIKNSLNENNINFDPRSLIRGNSTNEMLSNIEDLPVDPEYSSWETISDYEKTFLRKEFIFKSHKHLIYFLNETIKRSNQINHHPKIIIENNNAVIEVYTHDINNVTELDLELTSFIDEIYQDIVYINRV